MKASIPASVALMVLAAVAFAADFPKPYDTHCTERENVFSFTEKPSVELVAKDKYEITFAVKGYCDVTVGIVDEHGKVVRHLASGVLGRNAPPPFKKDSLTQKIYWNGKDDLEAYVKDPGKMKVRVMLGLKPEFDKRLGGTSSYNIPGYVWGLAVNEEAAYVFVLGHHIGLRKYDREGRYLRSLLPPPADLPAGKLGGLTFIEHEPGARALHGPDINATVWGYGDWVAGLAGHGLTSDCQPGVIGDRLYYTTSGSRVPSVMHWIHTDGSTDSAGVAGRRLDLGPHIFPRLAASPDGKCLYMAGLGGDRGRDHVGHSVVRVPAAGEEKPEIFLGGGTPGSADGTFNGANGVDCDAQGRVYVTDYHNSRLQVFADDGKHLKTIAVDRPYLVRVNRKTGSMFVFHHRREQGQSLPCMSKFSSLNQTAPEYRANDLQATTAALDIWGSKTRLWTGGQRADFSAGALYRTVGGGPSVRIWEEDGKGLRLVMDFDEQAKKEDGGNYLGRWSGAGWGGGGFGPNTGKICADPTRERLYHGTQMFDLGSGRPSGTITLPTHVDDIAFDKRGFLHAHISGCGSGALFPAVVRLDPSRASRNAEESKHGGVSHPEVPYDYGVEKVLPPVPVTWFGVLPVRDQHGAKGFQDGIGVNMRGDVAVESNIYYVPKMDEYTRSAYGAAHEKRDSTYNRFVKMVQEMAQRGEAVYTIRRRPGIPLAGGTVWTFDRSGELRHECAVTAGDLVNGAQIDEDGAVYFVTARPRIFDPDRGFFLAGRSSRFGVPDDKAANPFTGTLIKTDPTGRCDVLLASAPVSLDPLPGRPPELMATNWAHAFSKKNWAWVEGAEWLYAGASPIVPVGCSCSTQRLHLDWYKRSCVPEAYRHSFAILDAAGNLILHAGRYGGFDSASGPQSRIPVVGDGIGITMPRFITGTDNYLAFSDWGERIMVLKLNYHAEETVGIQHK